MNQNLKNIFRKTVAKSSLIVCMLLSFIHVNAGGSGGGIEERKSATPLTGTIATTNTFPLVNNQATILDYTSFPVQTTQQSKKIKNIVTLSVIEETDKFIPQDFTAVCSVKVAYGHSASALNTVTRTFTVEYKAAEGAKYNAKQYFYFDDAEYVKVTLLSINTPIIGSLNTRDVLMLQNEMIITRYFELPNPVPTPSTFNYETPVDPVPDHLTVNWIWPVNTGNNSTQLEWAWIENELADNYKINGVLS